ncbi:hypothetical protein GLOTRDRAFT_100664 [Gloeophyllum trabeum ATCC 11539]|uniref:ABM domain-containing protein n=1 Tax=Gloeophyllum trabeum (strain ATCC 11539 / FP-39264 / Madison 617) TaxID=670483 RepID=S7RH77_GLOTA|nr:uncharacterized protein GLOTRDRAFT_100664 [Gloeophyllum trabeum ATCC 11539]EPQ53605.1 hypothetical protein GLOTRDRAFT_100664 [Gloeophyllum trabeum ATCC 11539]
MSLPVAELVLFTSSEAYQNDQGVLGGLIDILNKTEGKIATYHGPEVEDPTKGYLFVLWQTLEHHKALMSGPTYPALVETLKPAVGGPFEMLHINFTKDPTPALEAPVTEVALVTLKPGKTKEEVGPLLHKLTGLPTPGIVLSTWGPTVEKEETLIIAAGWESVEAHKQASKGVSGEVAQLIASIRELVDIKITHGKLKKYD